MLNRLEILFRISAASLAAVLAILVISPIAQPVSDGYLFTFGIIALVLMASTIALWVLKRK